jgi:antitoxin (DNA-binding transcriptional repressor) of toxin-antitoxin stability system
VEILRHGKLAARLVPVNALEPIDFDWLDSVLAKMPRTEADGVIRLRNEDSY